MKVEAEVASRGRQPRRGYFFSGLLSCETPVVVFPVGASLVVVPGLVLIAEAPERDDSLVVGEP